MGKYKILQTNLASKKFGHVNFMCIQSAKKNLKNNGSYKLKAKPIYFKLLNIFHSHYKGNTHNLNS